MSPVECPSVTIKWRKDEPPYVEVKENDELILAGWVHPTPDGPINSIENTPNPIFSTNNELAW